MSKSLQDQLLDLGLASKRPAKKRPAKQQARNNTPKKKRTKAGGGMTLEQAYAMRAQEEKSQADKARRRKQAEDRKRREINQKIKTIVDKHQLKRDDAERARNFLYKGRIRKINVTDEQLRALNSGDLGLVYLSGGYHLLPLKWVDEVRALSADHVPDLGTGADGEPGDAEEEFPVPDDIDW